MKIIFQNPFYAVVLRLMGQIYHKIFHLNIEFLRDSDCQNLFSFKVKLDQLGSGEDAKVKS